MLAYALLQGNTSGFKGSHKPEVADDKLEKKGKKEKAMLVAEQQHNKTASNFLSPHRKEGPCS